MIWPILEARTKIQKYFCSLFGSNEDIQKSFWNELTFRWSKNVNFLVNSYKVENVNVAGRWSKNPKFCQRSERMPPNKVEIVSRTVRNWALIKACPTLIVMELIASQPIIFHRLVFRWDMTSTPDNHWADHKTGWAHKISYMIQRAH